MYNTLYHGTPKFTPVAQRAAQLVEGFESGEFVPINNLFLPKDGSPEEILEKSLATSLALQEALDATDDIDTIAQITLQAAENGETTWSYGRSNNLAHAI